MLTFTAGGERAIVTISANDESYIVYLPKGGAPAKLAAVFLAIAPRVNQLASHARLNPFLFDAGQVAADFLGVLNGAAGACLVHSAQKAVNHYYPKADLRVCLSFNRSTKAVEVHAYCIVEGKANPDPLFTGTLPEFTEWARNQTGLGVALKKVIRFKYNGGTRYTSDKIDGQISVVN